MHTFLIYLKFQVLSETSTKSLFLRSRRFSQPRRISNIMRINWRERNYDRDTILFRFPLLLLPGQHPGGGGGACGGRLGVFSRGTPGTLGFHEPSKPTPHPVGIESFNGVTRYLLMVDSVSETLFTKLVNDAPPPSVIIGKEEGITEVVLESKWKYMELLHPSL